MKKYILILAALSAFAAPVLYREHIVSGLKGHVLDAAVDPGSVKFRNTRISSDWTPKGSMMCGEMNARNRAGGYAGFQKFAVTGNAFILIGDDDLIDEMCKLLDGPSPWWYAPQ